MGPISPRPCGEPPVTCRRRPSRVAAGPFSTAADPGTGMTRIDKFSDIAELPPVHRLRSFNAICSGPMNSELREGATRVRTRSFPICACSSISAAADGRRTCASSCMSSSTNIPNWRAIPSPTRSTRSAKKPAPCHRHGTAPVLKAWSRSQTVRRAAAICGCAAPPRRRGAADAPRALRRLQRPAQAERRGGGVTAPE